MMGKPKKTEPKLFYHGFSLDRRIPQDHPLRRIKEAIDFTFVRCAVKDLYGRNGNISVDPSVILKLMFLLFYENIKSERALASQLPLRLDWLWFCDYDIDQLPPIIASSPKHADDGAPTCSPDFLKTFFARVSAPVL